VISESDHAIGCLTGQPFDPVDVQYVHGVVPSPQSRLPANLFAADLIILGIISLSMTWGADQMPWLQGKKLGIVVDSAYIFR